MRNKYRVAIERGKDMFLTKSEYYEITLPFNLDNNCEDIKAGLISIEAYGNILGEEKYCYASYALTKSYMYENGEYEQIIQKLNQMSDKKIKVIFKLKKGKLKDFKIDLKSLSSNLTDINFDNLSKVSS